jgi:uncharacterized membrane protein YkoI
MKKLGFTLMTVLLGASLAVAAGLITKQTAEQDALRAVGGGQVLQAQLDNAGKQLYWSVDILGTSHEFEVHIDGHTGAVLKVIMQPLENMGTNGSACTFISKASAEQTALNAVGGGTVQLVMLEKRDNPPDWSVDVLAYSGTQYEVKVNACTGKVIAIIKG